MGILRRCAPGLAAAALLGVSCADGQPDSARLQSPSDLGAAHAPRLSALDDGTPPPAASAPWIPPGTFACPLGKGDPGASCAAGSDPAFATEVDAAVHRLLAEQPELFVRERTEEADLYRVRDAQRFHEEMAALLQGQGFCAGWDLHQLQVRKGNGFSEQYALVEPDGRLHSGKETFRATCRPASFPLDAADRIHFLRVGFYGITCDDGRTPPRNGEMRLPLGCTGLRDGHAQG